MTACRAGMLDEGLPLLRELLSGQPVDHAGTHFTARDVTFMPAPARPVPFWIAARWPNQRPLRRAARYDGLFVIDVATPDDLRRALDDVAAVRGDLDGFDVGRDPRRRSGAVGSRGRDVVGSRHLAVRPHGGSGARPTCTRSRRPRHHEAHGDSQAGKPRTVSVVGLGCNNFGGRIDEAATRQVVDAASTPASRCSTRPTSTAAPASPRNRPRLRRGARRAGRRRHQSWVMPMGDGKAGAAPDYVRAACDASLARLGTGRRHVPTTRPRSVRADRRQRSAPRRAGVAGKSAPSAARIHARADRGSGEVRGGGGRLAIRGTNESLAERSSGGDTARSRDLPYFPLASGMLTGKSPAR